MFVGALVAVAAAAAVLVPNGSASSASTGFVVTKLESDQSGVAAHIDPHLVNPWGIAAGPTTPWWVADNGLDVSTLYDGSGAQVPRIVQVKGGPTGVVFNGGPGFPVSDDAGHMGPARFLFATESGTIKGWNPSVGAGSPSTHTFVVVNKIAEGAVFKGLAIAGNTLYATDFHNGRVDVFDASLSQIMRPGAFLDPSLPAGYAPFGIQAVNDRIIVTYSLQDSDRHSAVEGPGYGFVDAYDTSGHLLARVGSTGVLNAPWGVALAPAGFGQFDGDLLVGNSGDGRITAFRLQTNGSYQELGQLADVTGKAIAIEGLLGIAFGNGSESGATTSLFFAAGRGHGTHGLFGTLTTGLEHGYTDFASLVSGGVSHYFYAWYPPGLECTTIRTGCQVVFWFTGSMSSACEGFTVANDLAKFKQAEDCNHGTSGTGGTGSMYESGWAPKATQSNFIVVDPVEEDPATCTTEKCRAWGTSGTDGKDFVHALVEWVKSHVHADPNHFYADGFSAGGTTVAAGLICGENASAGARGVFGDWAGSEADFAGFSAATGAMQSIAPTPPAPDEIPVNTCSFPPAGKPVITVSSPSDASVPTDPNEVDGCAITPAGTQCSLKTTSERKLYQTRYGCGTPSPSTTVSTGDPTYISYNYSTMNGCTGNAHWADVHLGTGVNCNFTCPSSPRHNLVEYNKAAGDATMGRANLIWAFFQAHLSAGHSPPVNTLAPAISGTAQQGQTLNGSEGIWGGNPPPSLADEWDRCDTGGSNCVAIAGQTGTSYTLVQADVGSTIRFTVTGQNTAGSLTVSSVSTAPVTAAGGIGPTTPVLDDFNRANGPAGLNWTMLRPTGYEPMNISGNAAIDSSASDFAANYWNPAMFGPDVEAYATIANWGAGDAIRIGARIQNAGTTSASGYYLQIDDTGVWTILRVDQGPSTTLATGPTLPPHNGDKIMIRIIGTVVTALHFTSGNWAVVMSYDTATDGTQYTSPGNVAIQFQTSTIDNFGGGTI
jgi:uncharacterized protein (TIGR03118 family)